MGKLDSERNNLPDPYHLYNYVLSHDFWCKKAKLWQRNLCHAFIVVRSNFLGTLVGFGVNCNFKTVQLDQFENGAYFIVLKSTGLNKTVKVIKQ